MTMVIGKGLFHDALTEDIIQNFYLQKTNHRNLRMDCEGKSQ